jgi:hypothetical protein
MENELLRGRDAYSRLAAEQIPHIFMELQGTLPR